MSDCHSFCGAMPRKSVKKSIGDGDVSSTQSANNNKSDDAVIESPSSSSSGKKGGRGRQTESGSDYHGLPTNSKKGNRVPTVSDIIVDPITQLASEHWAGDVKVRAILFLFEIFRFSSYYSFYCYGYYHHHH